MQNLAIPTSNCSFKLWGCAFGLVFCLFVWILSAEANRAFVKCRYISKNHNKMKENHNNYKDWVKLKDRVGQSHHPNLLCSFPVVRHSSSDSHWALPVLLAWLPFSCLSLFLEVLSPQLHEEIIYRQTLRLCIKRKVGFGPPLGCSNQTESLKPPVFLRFVLQCHF